MATMQKASEVTETFARTTRHSYLTVVDHAVGMQERNVRFAQSIANSSIKELRRQAESNRAMTREVVERTENGREAVQTLAEEVLDAYMSTLYAPFYYYKEGFEDFWRTGLRVRLSFE